MHRRKTAWGHKKVAICRSNETNLADIWSFNLQNRTVKKTGFYCVNLLKFWYICCSSLNDWLIKHFEIQQDILGAQCLIASYETLPYELVFWDRNWDPCLFLLLLFVLFCDTRLSSWLLAPDYTGFITYFGKYCHQTFS